MFLIRANSSSISLLVSIKKFLFVILDLSGYVSSVTEKLTSKTGNTYYDVGFKISEQDNVIVRVMKKTNATLDSNFFVERIGKGLMLSNMSKSDLQHIYFYNQYYGSTSVEIKLNFKFTDLHYTKLKDVLNARISEKFNVIGFIRWISDTHNAGQTPKKVRDAIINDGTAHIPIAFWEKHCELKEDTCYQISSVMLKEYCYKRIATTAASTIVPSDHLQQENIDWTAAMMVDYKKKENDEVNRLNPTLICPEIVTVDISTFPVCANPGCKKKIEIAGQLKSVRCISCSKKQLVKKLAIGFSGEIQLKTNEGVCVDLTFFPETLNLYFGKKDILEEYKDSMEELEDLILELEDVDFTYNDCKKVVKTISDHEIREDIA